MLDYLFYFSLIVITLLAYPPTGIRIYSLAQKIHDYIYNRINKFRRKL